MMIFFYRFAFFNIISTIPIDRSASVLKKASGEPTLVDSEVFVRRMNKYPKQVSLKSVNE